MYLSFQVHEFVDIQLYYELESINLINVRRENVYNLKIHVYRPTSQQRYFPVCGLEFEITFYYRLFGNTMVIISYNLIRV